MKNKILLITGIIAVVFFLIIIRPVPIPSDEKDLLKIEGTVAEIYEGGVKDANFKLKEFPNKVFYFNRGLENGLDLNNLKSRLLDKEVVLKYPKYWTPLVLFNRTRHASILEFKGEVLYSELK